MTKTTAIVFIFLFSVLFKLEKPVSITSVFTVCTAHVMCFFQSGLCIRVCSNCLLFGVL